jgi:hypothetical protein
MRFSLLIYLAAAVSAHAASILSDLSSTRNGSASVSGGSVTGQGFTVNPGQSYRLDGVQFALENHGTSSIAGNLLNVGLVANSGGLPTGNALLTLSVSGSIPATGTGITVVTATPDSNFILAPSTTYWLLLSAPTLNDLSWAGVLNGGIFVSNGATHFGGVQGSFGPGGQLGGASPLGPLMYEIDATPITAAPEPSAAALVLLGLAGLAVRSRKEPGRSGPFARSSHARRRAG